MSDTIATPCVAESLVRGEPNAQRIALTVLGNRVRELP